MHDTFPPLRRPAVLAGAMVLAVGLAGCGGNDGRGLLDTGKRSPDEFAVYSRAPLSLPPDYGLRPPAPGEAPKDIVDPRKEAKSVLTGSDYSGYAGAPAGSAYRGATTGTYSAGTPTGEGYAGGTAGVPDPDTPTGVGYLDVRPAPAEPYNPATSPGVQSMLDRSGANEADPSVRSTINRETAILAEQDQSFVERLIFWGTPTEYGTLVDPQAERRRILENQALGRTITAGQTPTIERKKRAPLEGLFN